jgi:hypothetical protein
MMQTAVRYDSGITDRTMASRASAVFPPDSPFDGQQCTVGRLASRK